MPLCGFGCCQCGRCGKDKKERYGITRIPGECSVCGALNNPTASICKECGEGLSFVQVDGEASTLLTSASDAAKNSWQSMRESSV